MKPLVVALFVSPFLVPCLSYGQQADAPLTRAQVREQIVQLEKAGYTPGTFDPYYPEQIQAAQARLNASSGKGDDEGKNMRAP